MQLVHLRSFVAVVETGSMGRAGRLIGYSQPAVSLHVRALERSLRSVLLLRDADGVRLTDSGRRLLPVAREILRLCDLAAADRVPWVDAAGGRGA